MALAFASQLLGSVAWHTVWDVLDVLDRWAFVLINQWLHVPALDVPMVWITNADLDAALAREGA